LKDAAYASRWTVLPMGRTGPETEQRFRAQIPATVQTHRRLVRYRFKVTENAGKKVSLPLAADPEPNFAYFVYNGIPPWKGAIQPRGRDAAKSEVREFGTNVMSQVQAYFLIGKAREVEGATWHEQSHDQAYKYTGTFVADGIVY